MGGYLFILKPSTSLLVMLSHLGLEGSASPVIAASDAGEEVRHEEREECVGVRRHAKCRARHQVDDDQDHRLVNVEYLVCLDGGVMMTTWKHPY